MHPDLTAKLQVVCGLECDQAAHALLNSPLLPALAARLAALQGEAVALQSQLETQRWRAEQGARHRLDLLARLAGAGAGTGQQQTESQHNPLDGCLHVFIDLGSNRGLQIRFVFIPLY